MREAYPTQKDDIKICKDTGVIRFPCRERWLKGEEYGFLIRHYFVYSRVLKFHMLSEKDHPTIVYERPESKLLASQQDYSFFRAILLFDLNFISELAASLLFNQENFLKAKYSTF